MYQPIEMLPGLVGVIGFLASSLLFPLLVSCLRFARVFFLKPRGKSRRISVASLDILVCAHNEEIQIASTLSSIRTAIEIATSESSHAAPVRVIVGADACSDQTVEQAGRNADEVISYAENRSKWKTLNDLLARSQADWVGFVDAGSIWSPRFLVEFFENVDSPSIMGFAPGYRVAGRGKFLTRIVWRFERLLKRIENWAGGPVSVHGATVLYKRELLVEVMKDLVDQNWYNDDVVVPLVLRAKFPEKRLLYWTHRDAVVEDIGTRGTNRDHERTRRQRMVQGNVQWITQLLSQVFESSVEVGLLSLRRLFRLFWGWWVVLIVASALMMIASHSLLAASIACLLIAVVLRKIKSLRTALTASLMAPALLWKSPSYVVRWK